MALGAIEGVVLVVYGALAPFRAAGRAQPGSWWWEHRMTEDDRTNRMPARWKPPASSPKLRAFVIAGWVWAAGVTTMGLAAVALIGHALVVTVAAAVIARRLWGFQPSAVLVPTEPAKQPPLMERWRGAARVTLHDWNRL